MGLKPLRIYFDSCLVIYLVEEHPVFAPLLENKIAVTSDFVFVTSHLIEMECLILPLRQNNQKLIDKFNDWFKKVHSESINKDIFRRAAQFRADYPSLKTPDAIHLATAEFYGCDEFWTNDNRLDKINSTLVKNILTI